MSEASRSKTLARLQILAAAALFSTGGAVVKAIDLDGWQVAGLRSGIAAVFLLIAAPSARRGWSLRTIPVSLTFGSTMLLFVLANKLTTAANTIFLQSTSPLYLLLLSPWLLKEHLRRREMVILALIAVGMVFFLFGTESPQATAAAPSHGNWLAAGAGLAWALTMIGLRWLARDGSERPGGSMPAVVLGNVVVLVMCLSAVRGIGTMDVEDGLFLGFLGIVQIGVAYMFLTAGMRSVPVVEASLLLLAEPVLSPLWSWTLHGEQVGTWALLGGGLILAATAAPSLYDLVRGSAEEVP